MEHFETKRGREWERMGRASESGGEDDIEMADGLVAEAMANRGSLVRSSFIHRDLGNSI